MQAIKRLAIVLVLGAIAIMVMTFLGRWFGIGSLPIVLVLGAIVVVVILVWVLPELIGRGKAVRTVSPPSQFAGPAPAAEGDRVPAVQAPLPSSFADVAQEVERLRQQVTAGTLTAEEGQARMRDLMVEDADGNWWMVGYETGKWYRHDGTDWVQADPPGAQA
jgi:hypothetical protein